MHILVLALMIVLLPLRGWAGDVMAVEMASHSFAIKSGAASAHKTAATTSFDHQNTAVPDCHGAAKSQAGVDKTATSPADGDHSGTCQACQACLACHTLALSPPATAVAGFLKLTQLLPTRAAAFTSASAALGQKPPIS